MSINIQVLLSPGLSLIGHNRTMLEKIADGVLVLPRAMWLDKEVSHNTDWWDTLTSRNTKVIQKFNLTTTMCWGGHRQNPLAKIGKTVVYGILTVVATPILFFGLALKNLALAANPKARAYSHIVQNTLDIEALYQKKCILVHSLNQMLTFENTYNSTYRTISDCVNILKLEQDEYTKSRHSQNAQEKAREFSILKKNAKKNNKEPINFFVTKACARVEELFKVREDLHQAEAFTNNKVWQTFHSILMDN